VFGPWKIILITLGILGYQNKCFGGDFEGNLRAKHTFKHSTTGALGAQF